MPAIAKKCTALIEISEKQCAVDEIENNEFQIELTENFSSFVQLLYIMNKTNANNSKDESNEVFKAKVKKIMRTNGASELYIEKYLTDVAVLNAIINDFSAEDLAWVLLH